MQDRDGRQRSFENLVDAERRLRIAGHEAGHALLAWLAPHVTGILGTKWHDEVAARRVSTTHTGTLVIASLDDLLRWVWEEAAITAAGMAAEEVVWGRFDSQGASDDITKLLNKADAICLATVSSPPRPPWPDPESAEAPTNVDFRRCDPNELRPECAAVMNACFLQARRRIVAHRAAFDRLHAALFRTIEMTGEEISAALSIP